MSDLISRQAAIDAVKRLSLGETDATRLSMRIGDYLERLPSAQPDLSEYSDKLWRSAYERGKRDAQAKTGTWIHCGWAIACSECNYDMPWAVRNFCPNCGCRMLKEGEEHV